MKNFKYFVATSILATAFGVSAQAEVTGKYTFETAQFSGGDGQTIGVTSANRTKDTFKNEHSIRMYVDGDLETSLLPEPATYHLEFQGFHDQVAVGSYDSAQNLTQREFLREAYIDTTNEDWAIRAGKQQVVWGKADGMKLLDMINPTDFSEMAQNQMEDSRIPLFMINAEKQLEDGGTFQVILSQASENKFAGLMNTAPGLRAASTNKSVDQGHPFILKGIDTITGKTKGFLNIAPDMMEFAAGMGAFQTALETDFGKDTTNASTALDRWQTTPFRQIFGEDMTGSTAYYGQFYGFSAVTKGQDSSVLNPTAYTPQDPQAVFDYMGGTTAATMNVFGSAAGSEYRKKIKNDKPENLAFRYNNTTDDGTNYSLALFHGRDVNPTINVFWEDSS